MSLFRVSHTRLRWPLSLSQLVTDPAASRPPGKGRKCIVPPFDGAEAARPDLQYTLFSLTKLRCSRAYATCSQIPPVAAHLVTSRRPPVSPPALLHCPSSHVAACGSSIVFCPKHSSSGVLSILHFRPHTMLLSSLRTRNMLLFCRRMCHQLLLASNCFLSTSFLQTGLSISPRSYCDLLVNCTNHFFLKSVLCSSAKMSHGQHLYISL